MGKAFIILFTVFIFFLIPAAAGSDMDSPYLFNISINSTDFFSFANHNESPVEGNWIKLSGGTPVTLPALDIVFNSVNSSNYTRNGRTINTTTSQDNYSDYLINYPYSNHSIYTDISGSNEVNLSFFGSSHFADLSIDIYLADSTLSELWDILSDAMDGNTIPIHNLLKGSEKRLDYSLNNTGDNSSISFGSQQAGDYAIFVLLNSSHTNSGEYCILSTTIVQVLKYDSVVIAPSTTKTGEVLTVQMELTGADQVYYTYSAVLIQKNAYDATLRYEFNGTSDQTNLTIDGADLVESGVFTRLDTTKLTEIIEAVIGPDNDKNGMISFSDSKNSTNNSFNLTIPDNFNIGDYYLFVGAYAPGERLVAFNQDVINIYSALENINVTPTSWSMNISESKVFNATGYYNGTIYPTNLTFEWYTTPPGVGTLNATTGPAVNFTASQAGLTEIYAVNGSISSNETYKVWITVNAKPTIEEVVDGACNATSGNTTTMVRLNNKSVSGNITTQEIGDPLNETEINGSTIGLIEDSISLKGVNIILDDSIKEELNTTGGYIHIGIEYNQSQLGDIDEEELYMYKFVNGTGWVKLEKDKPSYCIANGRDTIANYIWVNVTECSTFLLAGLPIEETEPPSSDGGKGGGGGGGSSSGEAFENILCTEIDRQYVNKDMNVKFNFEQENNCVKYIEFIGLKNAAKVAAKVEILYNTSTLVNESAPDIVFKNLNVLVGNMGFFSEENLKDATITFEVNRSWVEDNNIILNRIYLYSYNDDTDEWEQMSTHIIGEDATSYQYKASLPIRGNLGPMAISGEQLEDISQPPVTTPDEVEIISDVTNVTPLTGTWKDKLPGFTTLTALIAMIMVLYLISRKRD